MVIYKDKIKEKKGGLSGKESQKCLVKEKVFLTMLKDIL